MMHELALARLWRLATGWPGVGAVMLACAGCSQAAHDTVLVVPATQYTAAFDAAVEAARRAHLQPTMRDRRAGLIETEPFGAGSILEPWRADNASLEQGIENTLAHQRRRARFEFTPVAPVEAGDGAMSPVDLTQVDQDVQLRVWVEVEREHTVARQRSYWSRRVVGEGAKQTIANPLPIESTPQWTPVGRDPGYEARLLAQVKRLLAHAVPNTP